MMKYTDLTLIKECSPHLLGEIPLLPVGRYVSVLILRETKSHAVFTTEGNVLDTERVQCGLKETGSIDRVLMFKRKQVAPERRTGRAMLRDTGLLAAKEDKEAKNCKMMDDMCGKCPDCVLYGFAAVSGTGAQKSRILTDSSFTVRPYGEIQKNIKLNAIAETTAGGIAGSAFSERDNLLPQVILPAVETLVDVTPAEFLYVLLNVLFTTRYGAEANREGFVRNHIVSIVFSRCEILSNLELTQLYYDLLRGDEKCALAQGYLEINDFKRHLPSILEYIRGNAWGPMTLLAEGAVTNILEEVRRFVADSEAMGTFLKDLQKESLRYAKLREGGKSGKRGKAAGENDEG